MSQTQTTADYGESFFDYVSTTSAPSAAAITEWLCDLAIPGSVIDVGCGQGVWAAAFIDRGVPDVAGVDGDYVDLSALKIPAASFRAADLNRPLAAERRYDLAVCLEVAEHLPEPSADGLIDSIAGHADAVLFSAAITHQGGAGHVNEQWPRYWHEHFERRGYRILDVVRPAFWDEPRVATWYQQNAFFAVRGGEGYAGRLALATASLPSFHKAALVHPTAWHSRSVYGVGPYAGPVARLRGWFGAAAHAVRRRLTDDDRSRVGGAT